MDDQMKSIGRGELTKEIQPAQSEVGALLRLAIDKDLDTEKLKALMDLRDRDEQRKYEKEFNYHFAEMQKEYTPVIKNKAVDGKYKYCPLPEILAVYAPILSRHGFSYYFEESEIAEVKEKVITCVLAGYGHQRDAKVSLPHMGQITSRAGNVVTNEIQARGATSEYGRRYAFMNVTGCIVKDASDTDGVIPEDNTAKVKNAINQILPLIPEKIRELYINQMKKAKAPQEFENILKNADAVKMRCQKLLVDAKRKGGLDKIKEIHTAISKITQVNELLDWEVHIEDL